MTLLLGSQSISKSFAAGPLFDGISLDVTEGERLGLIGPNGSGKSTLLRILAGRLEPDRGVCTRRRGLRVGYLPQEDTFPAGATIEQVLLQALAEHHLEDYERTTRVGITLGKFAFPEPGKPADELSGGWRKRLALARELIQEPDVLLLDEPTNHLDLDGILWLESLLSNATFAFVLVSHDRYLLEKVTNRVVELNRVYPQGYFRAAGNYSEFLVKREEFLTSQARERETLANLVRREVEWLRRGPAARTTKSQSRIDRAGEMMSSLQDLKERSAQLRTVDIQFSETGRTANKLLVAENLAFAYDGRQLFRDVNFLLAPGDRLGLLGANGSGKTTLMRLLSGELQPASGTIKQARGLSVAWFDQNREQLDREQTLRQALCPHGESVQYRGQSVHVTSWAKRFLFGVEQLDTQVGRLSGGEQARILIANLMLRPADILLLDEPTNDLDIPSLEVLEDSLAQFPGAIVLITHDRFMLDRLATMILGFDFDGRGHLFSDYRQWLSAQAERSSREAAASVRKKTPSNTGAKPIKLSYQQQRELSQIEDRIAEAEEVVARLHDSVTALAAHGDYKLLASQGAELETATAAVEALYRRWEELEALRTGKA
ncbi:MAG TPA: ABC-F family ATP-binding cassette domain-containing protein [Pirellulales bacterium]|nr:ABC-F family ATP-binding cassette domain-containing protein [Pirellulales bacterium]